MVMFDHPLNYSEKCTLIGSYFSQVIRKYFITILKMKNATIQSIMSDNIVSVSTDASIEHIKELFYHHSYQHLPVLESRKLVGLINRIDFLSRVQNWDSLFVSESSQDLTARDIMTNNFLQLPPDTSIRQAIYNMRGDKRGVICVTNDEQEMIGIVTLFDLINKYIHKSMYNGNAERNRLMRE